MFSPTDRARLFLKHAQLFSCPICADKMNVQRTSLICAKGHCFDIARHGYVNLLSRPHPTNYAKQLFHARKIMSASGVFEPLLMRLYEAILRKASGSGDRFALLDAGCGEGSHLSSLLKLLDQHGKQQYVGVGIDLAKEGIQLASKESASAIWCVADLADCPFRDKQFDVILNLLSPSNYSEFKRMLADDGLLIKAIPGNTYLQELRGSYHTQAGKDPYSNERIIEHFGRQVHLLDMERVQYRLSMDERLMESLIRMTPLSWGMSEDAVSQLKGRKQTDVSFDFVLLVGTKR